MTFNTRIIHYTKKLLVKPPTLTPPDLHDALILILDQLQIIANTTGNSIDNDLVNVSYIKIATFLTSLAVTGLDHKAQYIASAAKAILTKSHLVQLPTPSNNTTTTTSKVILDIVGTGGDGQNTFNVSTSSAIVASGIPGIKICKHGGKATTSNSGAGDMMNQLGLSNPLLVDSKFVPQIWDSNDFLFLLAPAFHDGMKLVAQLRKLMNIPTIFNILGPLLHPVNHINKRILGVYSRDLGLEFAKAAQIMYPDSETFVVWGHVGLDEVSPIGKTTIWHSKPGVEQIETFDVKPEMFGLKTHELLECASLGPKGNAAVLRGILSDDFNLTLLDSTKNNAIKDYILLNTSVLYCLAMGHRDWMKGVEVARESISSGLALKTLDHFIASTRS